MEQRPALAAGGSLQRVGPFRPGGLVPRLVGQQLARLSQELAVLVGDDGRDRTGDERREIRDIGEYRQVATQRQPERLGGEAEGRQRGPDPRRSTMRGLARRPPVSGRPTAVPSRYRVYPTTLLPERIDFDGGRQFIVGNDLLDL